MPNIPHAKHTCQTCWHESITGPIGKSDNPATVTVILSQKGPVNTENQITVTVARLSL